MNSDTDTNTTTSTNTDTSTTTAGQSLRHRTTANLPTPQHILLAVLAVATLVGATLRLVALNARPIHYDEGVHLLETWELLTDGTYTYTGYTHGPILIYLSSLVFSVVGPDIAAARTLVAILSLGVFPALYLLRDDFPPVTLGVAGVIFAVHPWLLYTARFYRNDAIVAAGGLLALGLYARLRRHPAATTPLTAASARSRVWWLAAGLGGTAAVAVTAKEVGYLMAGAVLGSVLVVVHFDSRFTADGWLAARQRYLSWPVGVAGGIAGLVFVGLFSGWPPDPTQALGYWISGIEVWLTRSSGDAYQSDALYYIGRLVREAPVVFGLALVGCLGTVRRPTSSWLRWPLLAWAGVVGLVLSFHDHQWLWLMTHVFVPVTLLAGFGVVDLAAAVMGAVAGVPRLIGAGRDCVGQFRRKPPSAWGQATATTTADGGWVGVVTGPTAQSVVTLAVAALVVGGVVVGAAGGAPRDVAGVTAPGDRDIEREALTTAAQAASASGCRVVLGPDVAAHPAAWYLRDVNDTQVGNWSQEVMADQILVGEQPLRAALANTSWQGSVQTVGAGDDAITVARPAGPCQ